MRPIIGCTRARGGPCVLCSALLCSLVLAPVIDDDVDTHTHGSVPWVCGVVVDLCVHHFHGNGPQEKVGGPQECPLSRAGRLPYSASFL